MRSLILFLTFVAVRVWAGEATIEILPEAFVEGPTIQLGEIARFVNLSKDQMSKIKDVTLGNSPDFGEVRSFSNQAISEMIRSKLPDSNLHFQIPTSVVVKNASSKIDSQSVKRRIVDGLKSVCNECQIEVRDLFVPPIEESTVSTTWDLTPDWNRVRGPFQIPMEVSDGSNKKTVSWVTGRVQLTRKVVVVKRNLLFNEKIQETDLEFQNRDITFRADAVTDLKEPVGAITKVPVTANSLLTRDHFQKAPAVVRGQNVTVMMGENSWNVSIKGVSEQTGFVGDLIRVLNPITKKIVMGVLVSEGVVEVR